MQFFPNRCQHIKVNGTQCGSPALRRNRLCYFHKRHHEERIELNTDRARANRPRKVSIDLPFLEDAESIQVSLTQIMRLIIAGRIDSKTAGLLLYALQTASTNLGRTRFQPERHEVILDPHAAAETPLGKLAWNDSDFEEEEDEEEEDDGVDPARRAGIMKAAEYLYELDRKSGGVHGFAPKPAKPPATNPAKPKPPQPAPPAVNAGDPSVAAVRARIVDQVRKAVPDLLAANPELARK
ncbi:MAG TPA: hypothetical protein VKQ11_11965 [Candidatus Sulfotelmatobacter sp.]|nr:hypothetical protein [Candidatus Sulfotelmatobacter sp.]